MSGGKTVRRDGTVTSKHSNRCCKVLSSKEAGSQTLVELRDDHTDILLAGTAVEDAAGDQGLQGGLIEGLSCFTSMK